MEIPASHQPAIPVLMVLLASDAVEVRYSDGSQLQLSPCGSVMKHHSLDDTDGISTNGLKSVQQRVSFVTSDYRVKVLQALDFRNQFAEQPYLCPELLSQDNLISLYADIGQARWPKSITNAKFEVMPNGNFRMTSEDEYASVSLSPHEHDFTFCYLSRVSEEKTKHKQKQSLMEKESVVPSPERPLTPLITTNFCAVASSPDQVNSTAKISSSTPEHNGLASHLGKTSGSEPGLQNVEEPLVAHCSKMARSNCYVTEATVSSPNIHDISSITNISPDSLNGTEITDHGLTFQEENVQNSAPEKTDDQSCGDVKPERASGNGSETINEVQPFYFHYTWVTKHFSINCCPPAYIPLLHLVQEAHHLAKILDSDICVKKNERAVKMTDSKKYIGTPFPPPLPITCPAQNLHHWGKVSRVDSSSSELPEQNIKVIMTDGIVYRLVTVATIKVVEVYPGDGGVIVSLGATGHLFSHLCIYKDQVLERTYSINALPPSLPGDLYCLPRILKRAHRILLRAVESEKLKYKEPVFCWQYEPPLIVEPLNATLLEECIVPGLGKFSAFVNGRVRIVFEDRMALDMLGDFSSRVTGCANHSDLGNTCQKNSSADCKQRLPVINVTSLDGQLDLQTCRILQTNGQYILVNIDKPGVYFRQVQAAKEWVAWVSSTPAERVVFYDALHKMTNTQLSADSELRKILCFNYIVENTVLQNSGTSNTASKIDIPHQIHAPNHYGYSDSNPAFNSSSGSVLYMASYDIKHMPQRVTSASSVHPTYPAIRHQIPDQKYRHLTPSETVNGFQNVRQALLQTAKMIQDIDYILEKTGSKTS